MQKVTNEDLVKISEFISSTDGLINGKFILADIKISNILKMIASNPSLYAYIKNCLVDFSFEKELSRAEAKNRVNNGEFVFPNDRQKIVAFVFCLLVECDAKRMDFYGFINSNFKADKNGSEYANFAKTLLVPFKEIIIDEFLNQKEESSIEQKPQKNENVEEKSEIAKLFDRIKPHLEKIMNNIIMDRRIKSADKETYNFIIKNIMYSFKYEDLNIVNAFISVLDILADKVASFRLPLKDIKSELLIYYNSLR